MLINPSVYNVSGRLNNNFDLFSTNRKATGSSSPFTVGGFKNSLADSINQAMNNAISGFSKTFNNSIKDLKTTSKALADPKASAYAARTVDQKSSAFSVKVGDSAKLNTSSIKVSQIATAQVNTSKAFAKADTTLSGSTQTLTIKKGSTEKSFNFTIGANENNLDALNRVAKDINNAQTAVSAKVTTDDTGNSKLVLTSKETGKDKGFEVSGSLANDLELNANVKAGQDLEYELNGVKGSSAENLISQDNGKVQITVKDVTKDTESFTIKEDPKALYNAVKDFAKAYNQFIDNASENNNPMTQALKKQFQGSVSNTLKNGSLEGVTMTSEGRLEVNEKLLEKNISEDYAAIKKDLTSFSSAASKISRKTDEVLQSPTSKLYPDFANGRSGVNPFIFNYNQASQLNNLNSLLVQGGILDVRV